MLSGLTSGMNMESYEKASYNSSNGKHGHRQVFRYLRTFVLCLVGLHLCLQYIAQTFDIKALWTIRSTTEKLDSHSIGTIEWFDCDVPVAPRIDCGTIVVPLDYLNHSVGTGTLALARYKATKSPKKGTVFLNPGGPGGSGVKFARDGGSIVARLVGPYHDLVGFDPRGIGQTVPKVQCFPSEVLREFFVSNTVFEQGFTVSSNLSDPGTREHLIQQYRQFLVLKKAQAELCAENMGDSLKYMGTATVARDIDFMATVIDGEDTFINFFGGSYGSISGAYLVNMFPNRVGRISIDGVANPVLWADKPSQYWHRDWIASSEDTFIMFLADCSKARPDLCPLARSKNEDPKLIEARIDEFLDMLYETPMPVPRANRPGFLTAGGIRALLLISVETPLLWQRVSNYLAAAMAGDGTELLNFLGPRYASDLERLAVTCLDSPPPASASEFPTADELGPERFTGTWNHTLNNPILIVSNTADPVTPLASGRLVNTLLSDSSRLLIQNSPGHCSLGLASLCTMKAYRAYFVNGTLPPNEFVCEVDESPFPKEEFSHEVKVLSEEDRELLTSGRALEQWMMSEKLKGMFTPSPMLLKRNIL
ncbi:hypothetical protein EW145_g1198 [Phellinidium pouzarii]|uniref:Peptidase S33 tripeptidyl aminopeptidase-like C-terminal domain-containing protein n=1 Tax=Phellinidium pouzarii TaxID=167371 RepID=A0A4S4LH68_9AGAM|nr:hypothetical protein EW145_g1198 [Phellinidium pouzarii]